MDDILLIMILMGCDYLNWAMIFPFPSAVGLSLQCRATGKDLLFYYVSAIGSGSTF